MHALLDSVAERDLRDAFQWASRAAYLENLAKRDALRDIARDIPDPETYARYIPNSIAQMLLAATRSLTGFKVLPIAAEELRIYGLCDYCSTELTNFGLAVRRFLKAEDA